MLVQVYTIIALLIFAALMIMGSAIEVAMLRGATVFAVLYLGTKVSTKMLEVIKGNAPNEEESPSHN